MLKCLLIDPRHYYICGVAIKKKKPNKTAKPTIQYSKLLTQVSRIFIGKKMHSTYTVYMLV